MSKFKRVLSDEWLPLEFKSGNDVPVTSLMVNLKTLKSIVEQVEQAVLAKLAEQEPVATVRVNCETGIDIVYHQFQGLYDGMELYDRPMPTEDLKPVSWYTLTDNDLLAAFRRAEHYGYDLIPNFSKKDFDPDAALTLAERALNIEITEPLADEIVQFARKLHEKYTQADHFPDVGKMITPLAQRKIQSLLDKGEYRVIENATVLVNENGHAAIVNHGGAFYWVDNEGLSREYDGRAAPVDIASDMCAALSSPLLRTRIKREVGKT